MPLPMFGNWSVRVLAVRPFSIHGDVYFEVHVEPMSTESAGETAVLKIPVHALSAEPEVGQRLGVTFLMGQVTAAAVEG